MADPTILQGQGQVDLTLGAAVAAGDLLGYSGAAWVKADADASPPIPAQLIAAAGGASGDRIGAFKRAVVDNQSLALTVNGSIYLSTVAGGITQVAPSAANALNQVVGKAISATRYEVDVMGAQPSRYVHTELTLPLVIPGGTGAADVLTGVTPGFRGRVEAWQFVTTVVGTGAGATRTPQLKVGAVLVTGTDQTALVLADTAAVGQVKALGAPTGANDFGATDTLTAQFLAGGTAFTAGQGYFLIRVREEVLDT